MSASPIQSLLPGLQTEIDLLAWLGQAQPGDVLEYHQGFLALDRSPHARTLSERDRIALGRLARRAMWLADQGLVHLLQRRVCRDRFSYLAIARPRTGSVPLSVSTLITEEAA